ncbi:MAG: MFS transporter [Rhodocyclaceae bacterium]|nr:MFS transporter [Rhodocyclaceae bacterium]
MVPDGPNDSSSGCAKNTKDSFHKLYSITLDCIISYEAGQKILPALTSSHYRRYFLANLISFTGTWIYRVVFGYLIYDVTRSAIWVGAIGAASFAPSLFLSLYAGALVDRINKKKFILFTQSLQGLIVAIFAVFHSIGFMNPWVIALVAALFGNY